MKTLGIFFPLAKKFLIVSPSLQSLLINFYQASHLHMHTFSQKIPNKTLPNFPHLNTLLTLTLYK